MPPSWAPDVLTLFTELAAIASPPGEERQVADRVRAYLEELGLEVSEDDAGREIGSNAGNLLCRLPRTTENGGVPIFLCAHLDTVAPSGPLEPVVEDGVVRNAGGTILGADNKAAVAAMLDATSRILHDGRPHAGVELLFTPKEEVGLQGAKAFDASMLQAETGFVFDQAAPIGDVILGAPYARQIEVVIHGRAAHAGMAPEEGRSAIVAASRAIADLRLGRLDDETTASVGLISGGTARKLGALIRLEVDGTPPAAYPRLTGLVEIGDEVLVNVQARELELGSGGFDVLYANLTRGLGGEPDSGAHVMTLPYTPLQSAAAHVEEDGPLAETLDGLPVICCSLHSQVAPARAGLGRGHRVAYVQVGGGALPVSLSDAVRELKQAGLIEVAVAASPCVDGDVQAVTPASALAWCAAQEVDAVIVAIGPR